MLTPTLILRIARATRERLPAEARRLLDVANVTVRVQAYPCQRPLPDGRETLAWFDAAEREVVVFLRAVRGMPVALLAPLLAHEFAHAVLWAGGRPEYVEEAEVDQLARDWGFDVAELDRHCGFNSGRAARRERPWPWAVR